MQNVWPPPARTTGFALHRPCAHGFTPCTVGHHWPRGQRGQGGAPNFQESDEISEPTVAGATACCVEPARPGSRA